MIQSLYRTIIKSITLITGLFLNGLMTILPITLTIAIFNISFKLIKGWLEPLQQLNIPLLSHIPHYEIVIALSLILLVGVILRVFLVKTIIHNLESLIIKLPLIRPVYSGIKQLVSALSSQDKITFKKVVIIEFPVEKIYSIGFLTSELPAILAPTAGEKYFNVFVPTTPNPTSGYFVIVPESKIQISDLNRQEAMALVISGGIIQPERFMQE